MHLVLLGLLFSFFAQASDRGGQFQNLDQMIEDLNLRPYFAPGINPRRSVKVAIFDNGFRGAAGEIGGSLPGKTFLHAGPTPLSGEEEVHGFYMARIFWSLVSLGGTDKRFAPAELHLYNTFGYSNFRFAVEDAIRRRVSIILYSQTWEYGGNFDGKGFINALVNKALDAGILWVNNAGNFGRGTFNATVKNGKDDWIVLPGRNQSVELRCEQNPTGKCLFRGVLSWNSFSNNVESGTDKDLDLVLTDDTLNILQGSSLTQRKTAASTPGVSLYPREIVTAELKPGVYFLRVKNRSLNFSGSDRLRITVSGDFVTMNGFDPGESLLPPADNPRVLTVGAKDSERSSVSVSLGKPELVTNSLVSLSERENFKGSSNSAAMVAAAAAVVYSLDPKATRDSLLKRRRPPQSSAPTAGPFPLSLEQLRLGPTGENCFRAARPQTLVPPYISQSIAAGGTLVETTAGWKIFFPFDPIRTTPMLRRTAVDDIIVNSPVGPGIFPRSAQTSLPAATIELLQLPRGQQLCKSRKQSPR
jgi:hypothetical protein